MTTGNPLGIVQLALFYFTGIFFSILMVIYINMNAGTKPASCSWRYTIPKPRNVQYLAMSATHLSAWNERHLDGIDLSKNTIFIRYCDSWTLGRVDSGLEKTLPHFHANENNSVIKSLTLM